MKRSSQVTLTVVAALGLAGCSRRYDPCDERSFDAVACGDAVRGGGYYWNGSWVPMTYSHPYPFYYDSYRSRLSGGGSVVNLPAGTYARPAGSVPNGGAGDAHSGSGVTRGGFGSTGAGHGGGE
jgi:hypothetical protein